MSFGKSESAAATGFVDPGPVLIVDDDDEHRPELRAALEEEGYAVIEAADGKAALDYLLDRRSVHPCLILLDLSMPVMTGWELLAIIKSYVRLAQIPVVVISGCDPLFDSQRHGTIEAFFRKPYDL